MTTLLYKYYAGGKNAVHSITLKAPHTMLQRTHARPARGFSISNQAPAQYVVGIAEAARKVIWVFEAKRRIMLKRTA